MHLPGWQREQKKKKEKKRLKFVSYFFLGTIFFLLVAVGFKAVSLLREGRWDGKSKLTIAINSEPILIASFNPAEKTFNLLAIPGNTYIKTIHGYGLYRAETLWKLGEVEKLKGELFAGSLQEFFGVPIDGWLTIADKGLAPLKLPNLGDNLAIKKFFLESVWDSIKDCSQTNLTSWDLIRLWWGTKGIRLNKINLVELEKTNLISKTTLPDGEFVWEVNLTLSDQLLNKLFSDRKITGENLPIAIYNGTTYSGLANQASRIVSNIGGQVVKVGDKPEKLESCQLRTTEVNFKKYTSQKLLKIFQCQYQGLETGDEQAEIILILGNDYGRKLNGR